jgi:hypothetical protein
MPEAKDLDYFCVLCMRQVPMNHTHVMKTIIEYNVTLSKLGNEIGSGKYVSADLGYFE